MIFENHFIYFPSKFPEGDWQPWHTHHDSLPIQPRIEDIFLTTSDGARIHGWFCQPWDHRNQTPIDSQAVVLWSHGNAGNITHRFEMILELVRIPANVFIFDYRGYGRSEGKPSEAGIYHDALTAWNFLVCDRDIDPTRIVLLGRSLGGAVAIELASHDKITPAGLIIESSFTSIPDMAVEIIPILPRFLIRTQMNSIDKVGGLKTPKLFVHSEDDDLIPYHHGQRLFAAAPEPKQFYSLQGAGHNDTQWIGGQPYLHTIRQFIHRCVPPNKP